MTVAIRQQIPCQREDEQAKLKELMTKVHAPLAPNLPRPLWFVAEEGEVELGRAYITLFPDFVTLDYIQVEAVTRGRAIGRALVDDVVEFARSKGARRILTSTIGAQGSRVFWEKCGFVVIGTSAGTNPAHDVHYLEKRI